MRAGHTSQEVQPASYGLDFKCRSISALPTPADHDKAAITHRFVVGTCSLKGNKIHLLEYDETQHLLECIAVWAHEAEIAKLSASNSTTKTMFSVVHHNNSNVGTGARSEVQIFSLDGADETTLTSQHTLPIQASSVLWEPNGNLDSVMVVGTADSPSVGVVKLEKDTTTPETSVTLGSSDIRQVHGSARDPHHKDLLAVAHDRDVTILDTRAKSATLALKQAHQHAVRSVDYNPNAMYRVVTSGDDNTLKVWDLRKFSSATSAAGSQPATPTGDALTMVHNLHDHQRLNTVSYNPSHDQLMLTGGSDHTLRLWQFDGLAAKPQEGGPHTATTTSITTTTKTTTTTTTTITNTTAVLVHAFANQHAPPPARPLLHSASKWSATATTTNHHHHHHRRFNLYYFFYFFL